MKFIVNRLDLGYTRVAGFTLFDSETKNFDETTPREVKELIKQGKLKGLLLNKENDIILDKEGFNQMNLMIKSAVGKYRTLLPTSSIISLSYVVVRVIDTENGILYETVNNRCGRVKIEEERLKMLMQVGLVTGVRFNDQGEIEVCDGVVIEGQQKEAQSKVVENNDSETTEKATDEESNNKEVEVASIIDEIIKASEPEVIEETSEAEKTGLDTIFTQLDVSEKTEEKHEPIDNLANNKQKPTQKSNKRK